MAGINTREDICNLALGHMGNKNTITNITTGTDPKEVTFRLWYDICRQTLLKNVMPNFALARTTVAAIVGTPPFGYDNMFQYPNDCLKVLGIGQIDEKDKYPYAIEGNVILINGSWDEGLPIRYIKDIEDVTKMSVEFKMLLSWNVADKTVMPIMQDLAKKKALTESLPAQLLAVSGLNAQENKPIRVSHSRYKQSRLFYPTSNPEKR